MKNHYGLKAFACLVLTFMFAFLYGGTNDTRGGYRPVERTEQVWVDNTKDDNAAIGAGLGLVAGITFWLVVGGVGIATGGTAWGLGAIGLGAVGLGSGAVVGAATGNGGYNVTMTYTDYVYQPGSPVWVAPCAFLVMCGFLVLSVGYLLLWSGVTIEPVHETA